VDIDLWPLESAQQFAVIKSGRGPEGLQPAREDALTVDISPDAVSTSPVNPPFQPSWKKPPSTQRNGPIWKAFWQAQLGVKTPTLVARARDKVPIRQYGRPKPAFADHVCVSRARVEKTMSRRYKNPEKKAKCHCDVSKWRRGKNKRLIACLYQKDQRPAL